MGDLVWSLTPATAGRDVISPGRVGKRRDGSLFSYLHYEKNEDIELLSHFGKK